MNKILKIDSDLCLRAALNPSDVSVKQITEIASFAYVRMCQEEKGKCSCGRTPIKTDEPIDHT